MSTIKTLRKWWCQCTTDFHVTLRNNDVLWCLCVRGCSVLSDPLRTRGLQPTRLLCPRAAPGKSTAVGAALHIEAAAWSIQ